MIMDSLSLCFLKAVSNEASSWDVNIENISRFSSESDNHIFALQILGLWWVMSGFATLILWRSEQLSSYWLVVAEVLAILQIFLPFYPPYKALRFFMGLSVFCSSISIHSRVWERYRKSAPPAALSAAIAPANAEPKSNEKAETLVAAVRQGLSNFQSYSSFGNFSRVVDEEPSTTATADSKRQAAIALLQKADDSDREEDEKKSDKKKNKEKTKEKVALTRESEEKAAVPFPPSSYSSLYSEFLRTYQYNCQSALVWAPRSLPSLGRMVYFCSLCLLLDTCIYLMREIVPFYVPHSPHKEYYVDLFAGIWMLLSLDYNYNANIIFLTLYGAPLPLRLVHRHPMLSGSLAEFWGIRWNPVIQKLLNSAFYKPLRQVGVTRSLCVLSCFLGSAALHALPIWQSTRLLQDSAMMGGFFVLQGVLLVVEITVCRLLGVHKYAVNNMPKAGERHLAAHWQLCGEFLTILAIVILIFVVIEPGYGLLCGSAVVNSLLLVALASFSAGTTVFVNMYRQAEGEAFTVGRFRWVFAGWLWTMLCVISCLPLFCVPVFHAIDVIYPRSIFVGPLLRIGADLWVAVNYNVCVA